LKLSSVDGRWQQQRPSKLDPFKPHLQQRWEQGCTNAAELYREVTALGFAGSYALVRGYVERHRVRPDPAAPTPPTVRQVSAYTFICRLAYGLTCRSVRASWSVGSS
jgi:hypothetical protein